MGDISARVVETISEQIGVYEHTVLSAQNLRADVGLDSLDEIEIVMALEDEFSIVIADSDAEKWVSTADVIAYVERAVASGAAA